jgi:hypothetical protein
MLDLLLGSSTALYQKLYDEELISDSFGHEFNSSPQYAFSAIGGDTKDPGLLLDRIKEEVVISRRRASRRRISSVPAKRKSAAICVC